MQVWAAGCGSSLALLNCSYFDQDWIIYRLYLPQWPRPRLPHEAAAAASRVLTSSLWRMLGLVCLYVSGTYLCCSVIGRRRPRSATGLSRPGHLNNMGMVCLALLGIRHCNTTWIERKHEDRDPLIPDDKTLPLPPMTLPPADGSMKFSDIRSQQAALRRQTREDKTCASTSHD